MRWGRRVEAGEASTFEDRIQGPLLSLGTQTFRVSSSHTALRPSYHVHPASGCSPGPAWRWPIGSCWRTAATSTASPSGSRGSRRPAPTSAWSSTKVRPGTWRPPGGHLYPLYPDTPLTHAAARVRVLPRPPAPPPARARQLPALTTALAVLGSTALLLLLVLLGLLCGHRTKAKLGEVMSGQSCCLVSSPHV